MSKKSNIYMNDAPRNIFLQRCMPIFGGFLLNLAYGSIYTFGNLSVYVTSYMRACGEDYIRYEDASWIYTIAICALGASMFFSGYIQNSIGIKKCCFIASLIFSLSVLTSAWTVCSFSLFALTYGFIFGICDGMSIPCVLSTVFKFWPKQRGFVGGIVLAGMGLSASVFGPLQTWIINPENKNPSSFPYEEAPNEKYFADLEILNKVPWVFVIMSFIFAFLTFIGTLTLTFPDPQILNFMQTHPMAFKDENIPDDSQNSIWSIRVVRNIEVSNKIFERQTINPEIESNIEKMQNEKKDFSPSEIIKEKEFWLLWGILIMSSQFINYMSTYWKLLGQSETQITDTDLSYYGNFFNSIANTFGRIVWGKIIDTYGCKVTFVLLNTTACVSLCFVSYIIKMESFFFFFWTSSLFFCIGGTFVCSATATSVAFGSKYFSSNYGALFTGRILSTLFTSILVNLYLNFLGIIDFTKIIALCTALSLFFSLLLCK